MGRFYETTFFDFYRREPDRTRIAGWQVVASPATINGEPMPYDGALDYLGFEDRRPLANYFDLLAALALVGDTRNTWNEHSPFVADGFDSEIGSARVVGSDSSPYRLPSPYVERLAETSVFAAETSPLGARSLRDLALGSTALFLVSLDHQPAVVIVGVGVGLVVIRCLAAVGGALWEGAHDEIAAFGGDTTAVLMTALRRRFHVPDRRQLERGDGDE